MNDKEREDRREALNNAVRHKLRDQNPDEIVIAAEKYLKFLEGK